jgi:hypothetical protein
MFTGIGLAFVAMPNLIVDAVQPDRWVRFSGRPNGSPWMA